MRLLASSVKAGRAATTPISRSVTNNGLPDGTHVLASVTRHRPEPWRHRTCGFVESGRSHPTRMPRAGGRPQCAGGAKAMPWAPHPRTTRTSGASGPPLLSQRYFASFRPESSVARKAGVRFTRRPRWLRYRFRVTAAASAAMARLLVWTRPDSPPGSELALAFMGIRHSGGNGARVSVVVQGGSR